jgi:hypothetical protein
MIHGIGEVKGNQAFADRVDAQSSRRLIENGATSWPDEDSLPAGGWIELEPHHHRAVVGDNRVSQVIPASSRDLGEVPAGAPNLYRRGEPLDLHGGARRRRR